MSIRSAVIKVEPDLAEAFNTAPKTKQKNAISAFRRALQESKPAEPEVPRLSRKESALFLKINQTPDPRKRKRIEELSDKLEYEFLTDEEHAELGSLSQEMEQLAVERLQAVFDLAKYRKVPPAEMMKQLGLAPGKHAS